MKTPTLFIDRDGTLIEEPDDHQVDELSKIRFMPGVIPALLTLADHGYRFVMVSNQDGLGSRSYPKRDFDRCQAFILEALKSQGVTFESILICPHWEKEQCECRKPKTGLLTDYLASHPMDPERSAVIGDRPTDIELASNLGIRGLTVALNGAPDHQWGYVTRALTERHASVSRKTKETFIDAQVNLDREADSTIHTGIAFFDHMLEQLAKHGGFHLNLIARGDLKVDEHHTVEDTALTLGRALRQALGDKRGISRYGFVLPMDEAECAVCIDLSGRPFFEFRGHFSRDTVGAFPTELVSHFFRSLGESLAAGLHVSVKGDNTHHMIEACFKAVGRCLRQAFHRDGRTLPSTKGSL
jgi:imidazoleglycerol-phosphate dehydratase/histidinol-phosphatase